MKSGVRIPGELSSIYNKVVSTKEGRSAMKRIRVKCGICKLTKYYSVHRGITRVSSIIACETCRHFYQKIKRDPTPLDCTQSLKGSCYQDNTFNDTKCKACLCMQMLDTCPHSKELYDQLSNLLSDDCQKKLRGRPLTFDEVLPEMRGSLGFEILKDNKFVEVSESERFPYAIRDEDNEMNVNDTEMTDDTDADNKTTEIIDAENADAENTDIDITEAENMDSAEAENTDADNADTENTDADMEVGMAYTTDEKEEEEEEESSSTPQEAEEDFEEIDSRIDQLLRGSVHFDGEEEEELVVDDPTPVEELPKTKETGTDDTGASLFFGPRIKSSERIRRKTKKVEYFTKPISGKKPKGSIHDPTGRLKSGKDLCDCLQGECPGCHFPCPKCRSPKCGSECRNNRRWYFERIEVEGTKVFWTNKFVKS